MLTQHHYLCPQTLIQGQRYSRLERGQDGDRADYTDVTFVAYTSCPVFVIVSNGSGYKARCLREDLYLLVIGSGENQ